MGRVGGWVGGLMVSGKCPTHPSFRLEVRVKGGVRLIFIRLWEGWVGGFPRNMD